MKIPEMKISNKKLAVVLALCFIIGLACFTAGVSMSYPVAHDEGYKKALSDVKGLLAQKDIELEWQEIGTGQYQLSVKMISNGDLVASYRVTLNCHVWHYDIYGKLVSYSHHPMTTTNYGLEWIEWQLFAPNSTQWAKYIAVSNSSNVINASITSIPSEITDGGLARAGGTYVSTGVGQCNVSKTFSVTATRSTKLYGVYATAGTNATLVACEQQGVGAQKNLNNGDSLTVTIQWQVT